VLNSPFVKDPDSSEFKGTINFKLHEKYGYNHYEEESYIDCLSKFFSVLVYTYCIVLLLRFIVRQQFNKKLALLIKRVDAEVHMQAGQLPQ